MWHGDKPVTAIKSLGYVVFGVSDLARWETFAVDLLGMQAGRREAQRLLLRIDSHEQRIVLEQGPQDDLQAAGWQLESIPALEAYVARLRERGVAVRSADPAQARSRCVERLYSCDDPNGFTHEFYAGPAIADKSRPFRSSVLSGPGFLTGDLGLGHILPRSLDYAASVDFYQSVLGLRISDFIREEVQPGRLVDATFLHTETGRHHSLATAAMPGPKILSHVMVEVQDMNDVGLAYDRCLRAGYSMVMELGHHPNDQMFSFYVETPSGFALEYGYGGIVIEQDKWEIVSYSRLSDWGHKRRPPPQ